MGLLAEISKEKNVKLNAIENIKNYTDFKQAYEKINFYAKNGYESIDEEAKKFVLKNFGIFDRPATLGLFMLRVRISSGRLTVLQAKALAHIAQKYARGYIDITTRAQVELRYLKIEDMPQILKELDDARLCSFQTGVDNFRNIVADPLNGAAFDSYLDSHQDLIDMQNLFLKDFDWISALPRKFNIGINGSSTNRCNIFGQDLGLTLALKDGAYGYNVYLGGKVGHSAQYADIFINQGEVGKFFAVLAGFFKDFGFRDNRNKNRLKFMIDAVGMTRFRQELQEFGGYKLEHSGKTILHGDGGDKAGKTALKDGLFAYLIPAPAGVFSSDKLKEAIDFCERNDAGFLNFTVEQNIYAIGLKQGFDEAKTSIFKDNLVACAGSEHCPFGVTPNKPDAIDCADFLLQNFGDVSGKIRAYWSACPKGCGCHQIGDIGVLGTKVVRNKQTLLGVDIFAGGSMKSQREGKLLVKGALLEEAKYYIAETVEIYLNDKNDFASFEEWFDGLVLSAQCFSFIVRFNASLEKLGLRSLKLFGVSTFSCGKKEPNEIYLIGQKLYAQLFEEDLSGGFLKSLTSKKALPKIPIPNNVAEVIEKMSKQGSYEAFSEIAVELKF